MECIFSKELLKESDSIEISGDEAKHLHVLRLSIGDKVEISNGSGLIATSTIQAIKDKNYICRIENITENKGELGFQLDLAFGIISDRNRLEFMIEKATELGVRNFYPVITQFSQKKTVNLSRLEQKALAAIKQSKRSVLPKISDPIIFTELIKLTENYNCIILAEVDGKPLEPDQLIGDCLVLVGAEGGFSPEEIEQIRKCDPIIVSLGNRRLRTETAAILTTGLVSLMNS
jgi:16S rRNA (uracil1498-N3)-methyltransferase